MSSKLKYRIVSCSSEDLVANSAELMKPVDKSKGWHTGRFCDYPQEVVLQFLQPVKISLIKFLSHEHKITTRMDLYVASQAHAAAFSKLGYLTLSNNEQSNFKVRELKSVYLDNVGASYVKLILYKPHPNRYNVFNQVGILGLTFYGELADGSGEGMGPEIMQSKPPAHPHARGPSGPSGPIDAYTQDRLLKLELAKQKAVENDDFDQAKRLKETIERLKGMAAQLLQLESQKKEAILAEDYDTAKAVKLEIDRLRSMVATPSNQGPNYFGPVSTSSHKKFSEGPPPLSDLNQSAGQTMDADDRPIKPQGQAQPEQAFIQVAPDICRFCGKQDDGFVNEDNLDIHWWKDCAMLITCTQCGQTIEITCLNQHLLSECAEKGMSECNRCNEAIPNDEFDQHVEEQACLPAKPLHVSNRCPLCHEDIPAGMEGWQQHILTEGCPNNDRSNF